MIKGLILSSALIAGGLLSISAEADTLQTGRSVSVGHASMHRMMIHRMRRHHHYSYGIGGGDHRTTATGGNAGGYTSRN